MLGIAGLALVLAFAGSYGVTHDFALSRDEILADFDAAIFRRGQLLAPVPEAWRPFGMALSPDFTLFTAQSTHWASLYLPINAAIRAFFDVILTANLANPVLLAVALLAVYATARQLWPERPDAALVAVLLLGCSTQALAAAMTSYAMTGHLALNAVWVWLYRRGDWRGSAGALAVGVFALGLHQLIFHVLFVAPFMVMLIWNRDWRRALFFATGYGFACLFWVKYWQIAAGITGVELQESLGGGVQYLFERVVALFADRTPDGGTLMALNGVRFIAWQSPLMLIFVLVCCAATRGLERRDVASVAGGSGAYVRRDVGVAAVPRLGLGVPLSAWFARRFGSGRGGGMGCGFSAWR